MAFIRRNITLQDGYKVVPAFVVNTATIEIDGQLSRVSKNPVQNKVLTEKIFDIEAMIPKVDASIDVNSANPVQNHAIALKLEDINNQLESMIVDDSLDLASLNPVQNKVICNEIDGLKKLIANAGQALDTEVANTPYPVENQAIFKKFNQLQNNIFNWIRLPLLGDESEPLTSFDAVVNLMKKLYCIVGGDLIDDGEISSVDELAYWAGKLYTINAGNFNPPQQDKEFQNIEEIIEYIEKIYTSLGGKFVEAKVEALPLKGEVLDASDKRSLESILEQVYSMFETLGAKVIR